MKSKFFFLLTMFLNAFANQLLTIYAINYAFIKLGFTKFDNRKREERKEGNRKQISR